MERVIIRREDMRADGRPRKSTRHDGHRQKPNPTRVDESRRERTSHTKQTKVNKNCLYQKSTEFRESPRALESPRGST